MQDKKLNQSIDYNMDLQPSMLLYFRIFFITLNLLLHIPLSLYVPFGQELTQLSLFISKSASQTSHIVALEHLIQDSCNVEQARNIITEYYEIYQHNFLGLYNSKTHSKS